MSPKNVLVSLLFVCFTSPIGATFPYVRNFTKYNNNSGSQNWSVVQSDNNWMYFANNKGLLEYDGLSWRIYENRGRNLIRSLYFDTKTKRLYAGSYNEFGYFKRNNRGALQYHLLSNSEKYRFYSDVWNIHPLGKFMVFQTETEFLFLNGNRLKVYRMDDKIYHSAVVNGTMYVAQYYKGISYFNGEHFVPLKNNKLLKNKVVRSIVAYKNNQILFLTDSHGIFKYDGISISPFTTDIDRYLYENEIFSAVLQNDLLAIGTVRNGLVLKNLSTNATTFSSTASGMQNNTVLSLCFDKQNNLWLGLDKGIDYCMVNSSFTDVTGDPNAIGAGYTSCVYNNKLYFGTNQGLYFAEYDKVSSKILSGTKAIPQIKGQIWNLSVWQNQLFCSCDKGLYVISGQGIQKVDMLSGVWTVKPFPGKPNELIGADYDRFFVVQKIGDKWVKKCYIAGLDESDRNFIIDDEAKLWVAIGENKVYRLSLKPDLTAFEIIELMRFSLSPMKSQRIVLSKLNSKLIASTELGNFCYDSKKGILAVDTLMNRLFNSTNICSHYSIDSKDRIWSISPEKLAYAFYDVNGNYQSNYSRLAFLNSKLIDEFEHINNLSDNSLVFGTENGFTFYNHSELKEPSINSAFVFKSVRLTAPVDSLVVELVSAGKQTFVPEFSAKQNGIRFQFVGTEYRKERAIQYSYLLDGFDKQWSAFTEDATKEYSTLEPGAYVFKVRSRNLLTNQMVSANYRFRILAPWYRTKLAYVIYILLVAYGVYLLILFVEFKIKEAARKMKLMKEKENQELERIFMLEAQKRGKEIIALKNKNLEYELKHKSQDLASSTMNLLRKNEALLEMNSHLTTIYSQLKDKIEPSVISKEILSIQKDIAANIENDNHWDKFQENFDLVYDNYLARLGQAYPQLTHNDKRICAYLRMSLSSKEIAPLVNTTFQSVEMTRHRLRKKLNLDRAVNLTEFLQHF